MKLSSLLALPALAVLASPAAGMVVVDFGETPFVQPATAPNGAFLDGDNSDSVTIDGLTLTAATVGTGSDPFIVTGGGTGIGTGNATGGTGFDINPGEAFTFSFDQDGTFDRLTTRLLRNGNAQNPNPQSGTLTFTNETTGQTDSITTTTPSGDAFIAVDYTPEISFLAGESIRIDTTGVGNYRFRSVAVTVPEPASLALVGAGAVLMLGRRRG